MQAYSVAKALSLMPYKRVLLIGDLMLDAYVFGETVRVSREAPVLVVRKEKLEYRLGGAANTAANLATLGLHTDVVGVIGDDSNGAVLHNLLQSTGSSIDGLIATARVTPIKTRIMAGASGTHKQQVLRLDDEPDHALPLNIINALITTLQHRAKDADVIVVSDYGVGTLHPEVICALQQLAGQGKLVCVDSRYQLQRFKGVTAVTPNMPETEQMVGFALQQESDVQRAGSLMIQTLQCQACLMTQGRLGMTLFEAPNLQPQHIAIMGHEEVTDVTGAGDTVIATFSAALASGLGFYNSMLLANCAAGIVVTKAGAASVLPAEILQAAAHFHLELNPWHV